MIADLTGGANLGGSSELATMFSSNGHFYDPISGPHMPIGFLTRPLTDDEIVSQVYLPTVTR